MISPLTRKQKWRHVTSINNKHIEGYVFIIKIYKKNVTFSEFVSIQII